jgi:phytoene/squalene synthetase
MTDQSRTITRKSASNLALAFVLLPKAKRHAMSALYAFCREVDDVADEETFRWKSAAPNWPPGAKTSGAPAMAARRPSR